MIVVTGATGQLGSQIAQHLLARLPAEQVGVSVRDPARASQLADRGVRVRPGDFADPASLVASMAGATQVLVVSANAHGEAAVALNAAAITAAHESGAERIVYTSHQGCSPDSLFAAMPVHAASEQLLARLGTPYTSLRNGFYAATVPLLVGAALQTGELVGPADGPVSWTTHADLAEAAAILLTEPGRFDGPTPALTGSVTTDLAGVAALLTERTGRTVRRVVLDDDQWLAGQVDRGTPEQLARFLLGIHQASRRGEFDVVDPALADLLGREPARVASVLEPLIDPRPTR